MKLHNLDQVLEYVDSFRELNECVYKKHCKEQYNKNCVREDYLSCGVFKMINKYGFNYLHMNVGSKL